MSVFRGIASRAGRKGRGRIRTRSGTHACTLALLASVIAHHGEETAETWLEGVKGNLARKPRGNDRARVRAIRAGACDIAPGNSCQMGQMVADP